MKVDVIITSPLYDDVIYLEIDGEKCAYIMDWKSNQTVITNIDKGHKFVIPVLLELNYTHPEKTIDRFYKLLVLK